MLIPFLLILLSIFAYKIRKRQMTIFERLGIPGPKPNLIFGNAIDMAKKGTSKVFPLWTKKYGPIVGYYIGGRPQILISDMELIRLVFVKDSHMFSDRSQVVPGGMHPQPLLQNTLPWRKGNAWKQLRSTLSPSFSISKLHAMEPPIMASIENMIRQIDVMSNSGCEFNFQPLAEDLLFSVSMKCFTGVDVSIRQLTNLPESVVNSVRPRIEKSMLAMSMMLFPSLSCIAYPLRALWETIRLKMLWSYEGVVVDFLEKVVRARKDTKKKENDILQFLLDSENASGDTSSLPTIRKTKEPLSENSVIAHSFMFLVGSVETTSTTLQFLISDLVNNQGAQNELRKQLKETIDLNNGVVNLQAITKVPLLLNTIKETLRKHPPFSPFTQRLVEEQFEYNGLQFPKGMGIFVDVMSIHNDPSICSEPEKYKPERFTTEFNKLAFLSFGAGPRNCIGMQFALMVLQLVLATMVLKYRFEAGPSTEKEIETAETSFTMIPKNGVYCKVNKIY